ncbi:hypothetical protein C8R45DRAFT_940732 [Mycena sanguinolenta]|nr:hypothetical protein C8R45DRAFT_940732 [Mycena sanguinolenta]
MSHQRVQGQLEVSRLTLTIFFHGIQRQSELRQARCAEINGWNQKPQSGSHHGVSGGPKISAADLFRKLAVTHLNSAKSWHEKLSSKNRHRLPFRDCNRQSLAEIESALAHNFMRDSSFVWSSPNTGRGVIIIIKSSTIPIKTRREVTTYDPGSLPIQSACCAAVLRHPDFLGPVKLFGGSTTLASGNDFKNKLATKLSWYGGQAAEPNWMVADDMSRQPKANPKLALGHLDYEPA